MNDADQPKPRFESVPAVRESLRSVDYLADEGIAGIVYLADRLQKPVLVEGPAGTGKTQLAKSVAEMTGARLIRLQCYEGLDEAKALYEWNYKKQLLRIQAERNKETGWEEIEDDIFSDNFLLTRPLLEAIRSEDPVVLLIDEVDRVEVETEALLLEVLSDYQVSIPELGTLSASQHFFSTGGRAFCLYTVIGSHSRRMATVPRAAAVTRSLAVESAARMRARGVQV